MRNGAPNQFILSPKAKEALGTQYKSYFNKVFTYRREMLEKFDNIHGGESTRNSEYGENSNSKPEIIRHESSVLDTNEQNQYDYILTAMDMNTLKHWTSIVVKKHHEKFKEFEENRRSQSSSLWRYLSWVSSDAEETQDDSHLDHGSDNDNSEFHITSEQIEEINKIVQSNLEGVAEEDINEQNLMFELHYA